MDEFVGPFASWKNVKTDYGAVGDGSTDDTSAIQTALDAMGSTWYVLYFPAGMYKISSALTVTEVANISLVGEHPDTTTLVWYGSAGGIMFAANGMIYSRVARLGINGRSLASVAIDQNWDGLTAQFFDTGNTYTDIWCSDVAIGLQGGEGGQGFAETSIQRCHFLRCSTAGISLGNANALDCWVWESLFADCAKGIANDESGALAGNFRAYRCLFRRSTTADFAIWNTGNFSVRGCTSVSSARFWRASPTGNPATVSLTENVILDSTIDTTIESQNQGPLYLANNIIRSKAGASAPIVSVSQGFDTDTIAIGNVFTVSNPFSVDDRLLEYHTTVVDRTVLYGLQAPQLPDPPAKVTRTVTEIAPGASTATIQSAITTAAALHKAVVHLQGGSYTITSSLMIPADADLQLVGDGYATVLAGSGLGASQPVVQIAGPNKSVLTEFQIDGNGATGMAILGADQPYARVRLWQCEVRRWDVVGLLVDRLNTALVDIRDSGFAYGNGGVGIEVRGGTTPAGGQTAVFSGAAGGNTAHTIAIATGGSALVRDFWYESSTIPGWLSLGTVSGTLTLDNVRVHTLHNQTTPALVVDGYSGNLTALLVHLRDRLKVQGSGSNTKVLGLGMLGISFSNDVPEYFLDTSSPAADARRVFGRQQTLSGSAGMSDIGTVNQTFILDLLAQTRQMLPEPWGETPPAVTDVRVYRVWFEDCATGLRIAQSTSPSRPFRHRPRRQSRPPQLRVARVR